MFTDVLIVEDYPAVARRMATLVQRCFGDALGRLVVSGSLREALAAQSDSDFDLVLLDLELAGEDGFKVLEGAVSRAFHTIVVSAHVDRAVEAFELGVLDFVPKPVREDRFQLALDRFLGRVDRQGTTRTLVVRTHQRRKIIALRDILWIKGSGKYSELWLQDGSRVLHDKGLDRLELLLAPEWFRIHKSYLVRLHQVTELEILGAGSYRAVLEAGRLPVGRSRYQKLVRALQERMR